VRAFILTIHIIIILCLASCSGTRRLAEGEVLYKGTRKVRMHKVEQPGQEWKMNKLADKELEAWLAVNVAPNGAWFGLPFFRLLSVRLFFYNLFYTEKEKGFSHWMMNNFGEPPVTIRTVNPELRVKKIENDLFNQGHFGVEGHYDLRYNKKKTKALIRYYLEIPEAYTYRNFALVLDSTQQELKTAFNKYLAHSLLKSGEDFNTNIIANERGLLWEHLQNEGYYHILEDDLLILADTTVGRKQVDIQYRIDENVSKSKLQKVFIVGKEVAIDTSKHTGNTSEIIKERLLDKAIPISEGSSYSLENTRKSMRNLASLGVFSGLSVNYEISEYDSSRAVAKVNLQTLDEVTLSLNGDAALKSSGFVGPSVGVNATHRNLLGGAENLTLGLSGYLDFPMGVYKERVSTSSGFAISGTLSEPIVSTPLKFIERSAIVLPRRQVSLRFELNNRADYFKIADWKGSYALSWKSSPKISHTLGILNVNYSHLISTTPAFDTLAENSEQVRKSFQNQLIFGPFYSFTHDNSWNTKKRLTHFYKAEVELSGNVLNAMHSIGGGSENGDRKFLGVQYSQYARITSELRLYLKLGQRGNLLAFRNLIGIERAYGNSEYMPFIKQFYVGGSNSLRPLTARTAGPGQYIELDAAVVNQVGDIKFETNLEYRFNLFYKLKGAIWSDAGNIWLWEDDPDRPFTGIRWGEVIPEMYLTSGVGIRLDFDYFVARFDFGAILYAPFFIEGYRWLWQHELPLWGPVIGIGYPF